MHLRRFLLKLSSDAFILRALNNPKTKSGANLPPVDGPLAVGTWGGDGAAMIVADTSMHLHVGCTYGDVWSQTNTSSQSPAAAAPISRAVAAP